MAGGIHVGRKARDGQRRCDGLSAAPSATRLQGGGADSGEGARVAVPSGAGKDVPGAGAATAGATGHGKGGRHLCSVRRPVLVGARRILTPIPSGRAYIVLRQSRPRGGGWRSGGELKKTSFLHCDAL